MNNVMTSSPPSSEAGRATVVQITTVHGARDVRVFDKMARSLAKAGFRVVVIHPGTESGVSDSVEFRGLGLRGGRLSRMLAGGVAAFRAGLHSGASVLHFHDPELIPVGLAWKLCGRRVVYDVHEDLPRDISTKQWMPAFIRPMASVFAASIEWVVGHAVDHVVASTEHIGSRFPAKRTTICRNYPEGIARFTAGGLPWAERPAVVAYTGRLATLRGLRTMVDAMALIPAASRARLVLAGGTSEPDAINKMRATPGWARVTYEGVVSRERVIEILGRARIGLHVVAPLPHFMDSLPIKLFEYMAAGIPAIVSDFPVWREIVAGTECGLLVAPGDPIALAAAIEHLLSDPVLAERMGANGRKAVATKYNWGAEQERLVELYRTLTGGVA